MTWVRIPAINSPKSNDLMIGGTVDEKRTLVQKKKNYLPWTLSVDEWKSLDPELEVALQV